MARKTYQSKSLKTLVKQPELWVGLATIVVVGAFALKSLPIGRMIKLVKDQPKETQLLSPIPSATITPSPSKTSAKKENKIGKIKTLADTSVGTYIVQSGDSFWKISLKLCGTGKYFESIQSNNGYDRPGSSLQIGDAIKVVCEE